MCNKFKDIDIKSGTYYFFDEIINIKNLDLNNTKIDLKSHKYIFIYYMGCLTIKDSRCVKIKSVNPL